MSRGAGSLGAGDDCFQALVVNAKMCRAGCDRVPLASERLVAMADDAECCAMSRACEDVTFENAMRRVVLTNHRIRV